MSDFVQGILILGIIFLTIMGGIYIGASEREEYCVKNLNSLSDNDKLKAVSLCYTLKSDVMECINNADKYNLPDRYSQEDRVKIMNYCLREYN
jgi:hypothetical protein